MRSGAICHPVGSPQLTAVIGVAFADTGPFAHFPPLFCWASIQPMMEPPPLSPSGSARRDKELRVLLVEDDEWLGPVLERQLVSFSASVELVQDPVSFLVGMSSTADRYDLAVVDMGLPGLSGDHLVSWMRTSVDPWIEALPILVVTGTPELARRSLGQTDNKVFLLAKPYSLAELRAAVDTLVPKQRLH